MQYQPYTYLLVWTKLNVRYYGARWAKNCHPSDLWNPYKSSSNVVKSFITEHGDPDVIEVRKLLPDEKSVRVWENKVLNRLNVSSNPNWLNKTQRFGPPTGSGKDHPRFGMKHSSETKNKIKNSISNRKLTKEQRDKLVQAGRKTKGRIVSEETRLKCSQSAKLRWSKVH